MNRDLVAPLEQCETTRRELLAILAGPQPAGWDARPSGGGWTMAEHVDHLVRSEVGTSKMVRRLIRGDFAGIEKPPGARLHDSRLSLYPYDRLVAPAGLVPTPRPLDEALTDLDAAHRRFGEELERFQGLDVDALACPDPASDVWFTLGGWVRLQALHEAHHMVQIRALLATSVEARQGQ